MIGAIGGDYRLGMGRYGMAQQTLLPPEAARAASSSGLEQLQRIPQSSQKHQNGSVRSDGADKYRCKTCEERTYQDGSNDPGVSMKTPTRVSPQNAAAAVMSHEREHVTRNAFKAQAEGREVVSSSVTIHTAVCPECGKTYVSGGTTRTVTAAKQQNQSQQEQQNRPAGRLDLRV